MKPLVIQFSGGRTSAFMTKFLFEYFPDREKHVLFENTGKEHEETLKFVLECDRRWDLRVQWLEAVVHPGERKASTHKFVDFESASRNGEPFEQVIQKYGLPNKVYTHCTRELKINVGLSYIREHVGTDYEQAIGIRADEMHRINRKTQIEDKKIYPLVDIIRVNKKFVLDWWRKQNFDLRVPENMGNCDFCYKKTIRHLVNLTRENPRGLDWWQKMGDSYATAGEGAKLYPRTIFRGKRTAQDLRALAAEPTLFFNNPEFEEEEDCFCKST